MVYANQLIIDHSHSVFDKGVFSLFRTILAKEADFAPAALWKDLFTIAQAGPLADLSSVDLLAGSIDSLQNVGMVRLREVTQHKHIKELQEQGNLMLPSKLSCHLQTLAFLWESDRSCGCNSCKLAS